jgi:hypothetical protein
MGGHVFGKDVHGTVVAECAQIRVDRSARDENAADALHAGDDGL